MKKFFCLMLMILSVCLIGCAQEKTSADVNQIPTGMATPENSAQEQPAPQAQPGKDYILAADDLSNLQLDDPTKPVYDKYIIWERQEKGLPIVLPELEPYFIPRD